jgi:shikimate kinase
MQTRQQPRAVFLVGFMGAGKSSVGQALAARLGWRFVDLDRQIEESAGASVAEIFAQRGESAFRIAETAALNRLLKEVENGDPVVAALGGGAVVQPPNRTVLQDAAMVFLDAPVEILLERCRSQIGARPLFRDEAGFRELYAQRRPEYLRARCRVDSGGKAVETVAAEIAALLGFDVNPRRSLVE